ncbi:MAG: DUF6443 domain-containing protein [Bacteroidota bacterium]
MKPHNINIKQQAYAILLMIAFLQIAGTSKAQTYLSTNTVSSPLAAGSYYHNSSITLSPGFSFTATSGNSLRLFITAPDCVPLSVSLSGTQNYISTIVPRIAGFTSSASLSGLATCQAMQTVQYIDGLGRPVQTVQVKGNPDATRDVIMPQAYDAFGREGIKYLPYTTTTGSPGAYRSDALTGTSGYSNSGQKTFYGTTGQNYKDIATPFAVTSFELSPLNRVVEQGAPGDAWQPASSRTTTAGRTVALVYTTNNDTLLTDTAHTRRVALYTATINSNGSRTLARASSNAAIYDANQLTVTISKDENWISGRAGTIEEYKDKEGHVVLKRTFNYKSGALEILSTYYVYDDMSQLAFVLPPGANPDAASAITQTTLDNLCYQYRYDERNRLSQKKLPGKGWEMMVYNQLDQVVLTQDSIQRLTNQWVVSKYDALGRTIITGRWNAGSTISQATLQASIYAAAQWDKRDSTNTPSTYPTGYIISSYPSTLNDILAINYYDDYSIPNLPATYDQHSSYSTMTRGLGTASKTAILNTDGSVSTDMLWSVHYYDDKGRSVKSYAQHYLGGVVSNYNYDDITTAYDFTNAVTSATRLHYAKNGGNTAAVLALTIGNTYDYDHLGRKVKSWEQINGGTNVLLSKQEYNEVGQLYKKYLHSTNSGSSFAQNVAYNYNERGWMKTANTSGSLFNMELKYNDGTVPQFNGNIANQVWTTQGQSQQTYTYKYDKLNRLTEGKAGTYQERGISYDVMGNITALSRVYGNTLIDSLSYNYLLSSNPSNQLQTVSDKSADTGPVGYKTGNNWAYSYDGNGNMTADNSKSLTITYNMLNLPKTNTITGTNAGVISYVYDAGGQKLRRISTQGSGSTADYISGIQYNGTSIEFAQTGEGRILNPTSSPSYEYSLSDHLGNTRATFDGSGALKQADDYLPFGMDITIGSVPSQKNNYLYNKKELQDGLGQYDYGARFYDPVIARWTSVDPKSEIFQHWSPYNYASNDPISNTDPDGKAGESFRTRYVDPSGNTVLNTNDGRDDIYLVPWERIGDLLLNARTHDQQNSQDVDSKEWNDHWRSKFKQVVSDYSMKHYAFGFDGLSNKLQQEWIHAAITGDSEDQWEFNRDYAISQWKDPVVVVGSLIAFADAGVRAVPLTVDEVMDNPNALRGRTPENVEQRIGQTENWKVEKLGKGSKKGQGWVLREYNGNGQPTGRVMRWHPGGGHHGPDPYYKVSNGSTTSGEIRPAPANK